MAASVEIPLSGSFGLEKESLRVDEVGFLAHTPHPFPDDPNIVWDFCENQTEINTSVQPSPHAAVVELERHTQTIQQTLAKLTPREYLWPFSNPPYIRSKQDIPVAQFAGPQSEKTVYRNYLSKRYGPTSAMEHTIISAAMTRKEDGVEEVSLNIAPLAGIDITKADTAKAEKLMYELFDKMDFGYDFKNLYRFKSKFAPSVWKQRYLVFGNIDPSIQTIRIFSDQTKSGQHHSDNKLVLAALISLLP